MKHGRNRPFSQIETSMAKIVEKGANLPENAPHFSLSTFQNFQNRSQIPPFFGQKPICENVTISCILQSTNRPKQRAQSQKNRLLLSETTKDRHSFFRSTAIAEELARERVLKSGESSSDIIITLHCRGIGP